MSLKRKDGAQPRMKRWWELVILACGILLVVPVAFLAFAFGPYAIFGVPLAAVAAFFVYRRVRRQRIDPTSAGSTPRRMRVRPTGAITDADVSDLPEPITACPDCGYLAIRMPGIGDGLWPGGGETGSRMVCPRCDWQGLPVSFERREDYAEFLRELAARSDVS